MPDVVSQPWPWYVAGPLIGLVVPLLLILGGKVFGVSANLRHMCAASVPGNIEFLKYDWKAAGMWNLTFMVGTLVGGFLAVQFVPAAGVEIGVSAATKADLSSLGITDFTGLVPQEVISWSGLMTLPGLILIVGGGFLVGFGARYAGGCTSGHAISGLADLQLPSLVAVIGFFVGGLIVTHLLLPFLL
ncbi:MAG: YeeE/YedE thiosulfate transporter family protein [Rhodothermales bacterium]